ncbi:MAG TPA: hypothetical protein VK970_07740 [Candidatus Methylacidiphilales bacterium]|nr:hypothetical protein [Candidatus Methylacidiphilales bacterium]
MSKIQESLEKITATEDRTDRLTMLAGLISTLMKIKGVKLALTGNFAYERYVNAVGSENDLELAPYAGKLTPRLVQEIFAEQLGAEGQLWEWAIADIRIRLAADVQTTHRDLCREYKSEFGSFRILPIEELIAERVVAAFFPFEQPRAREEAKTLLMYGLSDTIPINWELLQEICSSEGYFTGDRLGTLRAEAKTDLDAYLAEQEQAAAAEVTEAEAEVPAESQEQAPAAGVTDSQAPSAVPKVNPDQVTISRNPEDKEASKRMTTKLTKIMPVPRARQ